MKKEILKIQIIQTIFVAIIFIIALLEKARYLSNNLILFYVFSIFGFGIIISILAIIFTIKNKHKEKNNIIVLLAIIFTELIMLLWFCTMIADHVDIEEFSKHCEKTEAYVYDLTKDIDIRYSYNSSNKRPYTVDIECTYKIQYEVNGQIYKKEIKEYDSESVYSRSDAEYKGKNYKPEYKVDDRLDIYYNIYNPDDWRKDLTYASDKTIYITGSIVIGFQLLCLGKAIRDYKKSKEEKTLKDSKENKTEPVIKKLNQTKKEIGLKDYAIKIAYILYELSLELKKIDVRCIDYYPSIKCQKPSNGCAPLSAKEFEEKCYIKSDIIGFVLSTSCVIGNEPKIEDNKCCKITVVFDINKEDIHIKYTKEFENELFDKYLNKIKESLQGKKYKIENVNKKIPVVEWVNLGILGQYPINKIVCEDYFESDSECDKFIKEIIKGYTDNIEEINKKILFEIYKSLEECATPIWQVEEFYKIIDKEKLPKNFEKMSEEDKEKVVYKNFKYNDKNIVEKVNQNVPFLNINKLKENLKVTNINIDKKYKEISIEFNGIENYILANIVLDYEQKYKVKRFTNE